MPYLTALAALLTIAFACSPDFGPRPASGAPRGARGRTNFGQSSQFAATEWPRPASGTLLPQPEWSFNRQRPTASPSTSTTSTSTTTTRPPGQDSSSRKPTKFPLIYVVDCDLVLVKNRFRSNQWMIENGYPPICNRHGHINEMYEPV